MIYLKEFETQAAYDAAKNNLPKPNVSLITEGNEVKYMKESGSTPTPPTGTRVICDYYFGEKDSLEILYNTSTFSLMEVDGTDTNVSDTYDFDTRGKHTIKFTLTNPTIIGNETFYYITTPTAVTIPNSVTTIGERAFYNCTGLETVIIGSGVTSISDSAFEGGESFTSVTCFATTPPTLGGGVFAYTKNCPIYVPAGSVNTYKTAWSEYADRIQAIQ